MKAKFLKANGISKLAIWQSIKSYLARVKSHQSLRLITCYASFIYLFALISIGGWLFALVLFPMNIALKLALGVLVLGVNLLILKKTRI